MQENLCLKLCTKKKKPTKKKPKLNFNDHSWNSGQFVYKAAYSSINGINSQKTKTKTLISRQTICFENIQHNKGKKQKLNKILYRKRIYYKWKQTRNTKPLAPRRSFFFYNIFRMLRRNLLMSHAFVIWRL